MRLLISGGPGSGCTSTAERISQATGIPMFDSDSFFHKPSDPPFQEQYSPEERRVMLGSALSKVSSWIVSGSVAVWGLNDFKPTHGVLLNVSKEVRLQRLIKRQEDQFGSRIDVGGDMHDEHEAFLDWAGAYEEKAVHGRNLSTDREFVLTQSDSSISIAEVESVDGIVRRVLGFVSDSLIVRGHESDKLWTPLMQKTYSSQTELLRTAYAAFNARDIDAALVLMTPDVAWPRAFKGGFVRGPEEVRAYWTEQWSEIDPNVEPLAFHMEDDGRIMVEVRQVVRDLAGALLAEERVGHRFTLENGLIQGMEVCALTSACQNTAIERTANE